jgi:hypothetical protein
MSERMLVATRKGLFTLTRTKSGWSIASTAFLGSPVSNVLHDARDGAIYAALNLGHFGAKLHRSDDGGKHWRELPAPAFPSDTAGEPSVQLYWNLEAGAPSQPGRLWIGAIPAGLFRSDDRGESWHLVGSLWNVPEREKWVGGGYDNAGIHSISLDPRDSNELFIAVSVGGVWKSGDGGESWSLHGDGLIATYMPPDQAGNREMQDPHRVVRCPAALDVMWMQHHNGIFRSSNAGSTWTQLKPPGDDIGFAVAAHPNDSATAWFVPAVKDEFRYPRDGAMSVTRTRDGGNNWEIFRDGLPQRDAYDLVYRHGLDVDDTGARLAMGSTTGALWVSDDAGERWQLINAHLPPIYAVHFH